MQFFCFCFVPTWLSCNSQTNLSEVITSLFVFRMTEVALVPFFGLILYCITYILVLLIWAWSFGEDLSIEEDDQGRRRVCANIVSLSNHSCD